MRTELKKLNNKGITLIALVITIIVLLILAGVSIAMLTGENGILTQAQNAKKETERANIIEQVRLDILEKQTEKEGENITSGELEEILKKYFSNDEENLKDIIEGTSTDKLISKEDETIKIDLSEIYDGKITDEEEVIEPQPTPEPEPGGSLATTDNGVIEIRWLKDDTYNVSETANAPVIGSNLPANTTMKLVKYDGSNWVEGTDYEYKAGSGIADNRESKWANAEVTIDNVKSYFVWVPRYAYRIIYFDTPTNKEAYLTNGDTSGIIGYSDSRGIVDKDGKKVGGVASTTSINVGDYFRVHPAFMNDSSSNYSNGGWNGELPGIWVGKYETARSDSEGTTQGTSTKIKVQPGVTSWRNTKIGDMYTYAKEYSTNLNSHMLKNSEWGAVAYLTESKYGRNGTEVTINNSSDYITGSAGNSVSADEDVGTTSEYWSPQGVLASSTGNVYGIYDLSGGAYEYVASYYSGSTSSNLTNNGSQLVNETEKKYVTAYTGTNETTDYKPGDATYETKGWHNDYADFVNSDGPVFERGGGSDSGSDAGVFDFYGSSGNRGSSYSFRMCLAVK